MCVCEFPCVFIFLNDFLIQGQQEPAFISISLVAWQTKRVCGHGTEPEEDSAVKALVHLRLVRLRLLLPPPPTLIPPFWVWNTLLISVVKRKKNNILIPGSTVRLVNPKVLIVPLSNQVSKCCVDPVKENVCECICGSVNYFCFAASLALLVHVVKREINLIHQ